jgi:hypothetical protein
MPNGHDTTYNKEWCDERHSRQDKILEDLGKTLVEIKTDLSAIKTSLAEREKGDEKLNAEREKGQTKTWQVVLFLLGAVVAGGGTAAIVNKALAPQAQTQTPTEAPQQTQEKGPAPQLKDLPMVHPQFPIVGP